MATTQELERRLDATEATWEAMFCTVTADLIMFQAAVTPPRQEGSLTAKMAYQMVIDAQRLLRQYDTPALNASMTVEIASQVDGLAKRLRNAVASPSRADGLDKGPLQGC